MDLNYWNQKRAFSWGCVNRHLIDSIGFDRTNTLISQVVNHRSIAGYKDLIFDGFTRQEDGEIWFYGRKKVKREESRGLFRFSEEGKLFDFMDFPMRSPRLSLNKRRVFKEFMKDYNSVQKSMCEDIVKGIKRIGVYQSSFNYIANASGKGIKPVDGGEMVWGDIASTKVQAYAVQGDGIANLVKSGEEYIGTPFKFVDLD